MCPAVVSISKYHLVNQYFKIRGILDATVGFFCFDVLIKIYTYPISQICLTVLIAVFQHEASLLWYRLENIVSHEGSLTARGTHCPKGLERLVLLD